MPLVVTMAKGVLLGQAGTDDFNMGACKGDQVIFSKVACINLDGQSIHSKDLQGMLHH